MKEADLIDRAALDRNRARMDPGKGTFLHDLARDEIDHRLSLVNKAFNSAAVVTPVPAAWDGMLPDMRCVPDTDTLDLAPASHDLVVHAMCLHWANDPVGQLIQCARALRPDGLLLTVCLGGQTLHELRAALATAEAEITGGLSPRVLPMGDVRDLGALLQRAGLALPVADSSPVNVTYRTPLHLMQDLRRMGETNALSDRLKHPTRRAVLMRAIELYTRTHATDGGVTATFDMITLTGWAPDASQPQPLRPGSATARLADVLGAVERPLKD
ncbi:methyltransferase domain-containing protein [Pseudaestuariivita atlantica]|uniref:SAM-dependent methyltransferase n=1 Tax=Pseudaestuariivita atlantica TaxID=1317121 RepID=A0A0L1JPI4_9RHOB|nr:methyltransferase domain-containing protein [Pseudaestuariivita atlantica]KNG93674.1 SAM-dependent methyltransferase [Pseudaestuariivita atlantica]